MTGQLIKFVLSFMGTMAGVAAVLAALIIFSGPHFEEIFIEHGTLVSVIFALTGMFITLMFFKLQDIFIVFRPEPGTAPLSGDEIMERIEKAFSAPVNGEKLFDVARTGGKLIITWSADIDYFQITNAGASGMKRVIVLSFDESSHRVFFIMKDKDWKWNISAGAGSFSLNYSEGIYSEYRFEAYPSIEFSEGGLKVDMKKLTYNSNDLWMPIHKAVTSGGWSLHGGMIPKLSHRIIFALPIALLFFGIGFFFTFIIQSSEVKTPAETPARIEKSANHDITRQVEIARKGMNTEALESQLRDIMKMRKHYDSPELRKTFTVYANGYLKRKDRKDDFALQIRTYARENGLEGIKE